MITNYISITIKLDFKLHYLDSVRSKYVRVVCPNELHRLLLDEARRFVCASGASDSHLINHFSLFRVTMVFLVCQSSFICYIRKSSFLFLFLVFIYRSEFFIFAN